MLVDIHSPFTPEALRRVARLLSLTVPDLTQDAAHDALTIAFDPAVPLETVLDQVTKLTGGAVVLDAAVVRNNFRRAALNADDPQQQTRYNILACAGGSTLAITLNDFVYELYREFATGLRSLAE